MLGLRFNPVNGFLLVIDFGAGKVLHVDPVSGASSVFATVTGNSGLNALTFDKAGNAYISDSFQGIIWKVGASGGTPTVWSWEQRRSRKLYCSFNTARRPCTSRDP